MAQVPLGGPPAPPKDSQAAQWPQGVEKLQEEIRQLRDQLQELKRQTSAITGHLTFGPEADLQREDYATARARFATKLLRRGPSPQTPNPLKLPAGVSEVEYMSGDLRLKAWVSRPSGGNSRRPAVLLLHGFAFGMGDWELTKQYREAGFVAMVPMLRGENGLPGAFSYFYDEVDDVVAAAEYLSRQPYVDTNRMFLAGHSVGGTLTLLTAMTTGRFRAAASFDGFPYWGPFIEAEAKDLPLDKSNALEIQMRSAIAYAAVSSARYGCIIRPLNEMAWRNI